MHARLFQLADLLPVDLRGRRLHQRERALEDVADDVEVERGVGRLGFVVRAAPVGIVVEAGEIEHPGKPEGIEPIVERHQVRRDRQVRRDAVQRLHLGAHEVDCLVGDEALPAQRQAVHIALADGRRAVQLAPVGVRLGPESRPPRMVERVERAVFALQKFAKRLLAQFAVTCAAVFVGNVPADDGRMMAEALGERRVDPADELAVDRRGEAVVVAVAVQIAPAVLAHAQHLGVLFAHPRGARAAGRGEKGVDAIFGEAVEHVLEPVEVKAAFLRLERRPCEDADAHQVAAGELHQPDVLFEDVRLVAPLVGVVIAAVAEEGEIQFGHGGGLLSISRGGRAAPRRPCRLHRRARRAKTARDTSDP